jgi:hypothetical protein
VTTSSNPTEDIIQILGNLQPYLRRPIIKNKLDNFFKEEDELQLDTIDLIVKSLPNVDLQQYEDLIKTWLEILTVFDTAKVNHITRLYLQDLAKNPKLISLINPLIIKCVRDLSKQKQDKLRNCFLETLFLLPFDKNLVISKLNQESIKWLTNNDVS